MFVETRDEEVFKKFWHDEKENSPRYFNDSGNTWHCSESDFLEFCSRMWRIYLVDDTALIYIESTGEVHLSVLRGADTSTLVSNLIEMRNEVFKKIPLLFAWVGKGNRGIRKLMKGIGGSFHGFTMVKGESHGRALEWECYMATQKEFLVALDNKKLINSV